MADEAPPPRVPRPATVPVGDGSPKPAPRAPDQPIKARKSLLFADDDRALAAGAGPRKRFRDYLHETPAAPLPTGTRALLWGVGLLVAALLLAALLRGQSGGKSRAARKSRADAVAVRRLALRTMTNGK